GDGVTVTTDIGFDPTVSSPKVIQADPTVALGQVLPLDLVVSDPAASYIGSDHFYVDVNTDFNSRFDGFDGYLLFDGEESIINGGAGDDYEPYGSLASLNQALGGGNLLFVPMYTGTPVIATTGGEIAAAWSVDTPTTFAGVVDAAGTSAAPSAAFEINDNATATFLPGSALFDARLVEGDIDGILAGLIAGNTLVVGDTSPGTLVAAGD